MLPTLWHKQRQQQQQQQHQRRQQQHMYSRSNSKTASTKLCSPNRTHASTMHTPQAQPIVMPWTGSTNAKHHMLYKLAKLSTKLRHKHQLLRHCQQHCAHHHDHCPTTTDSDVVKAPVWQNLIATVYAPNQRHTDATPSSSAPITATTVCLASMPSHFCAGT